MASIFTRIIDGDIPGRIIWRDELVVAMVDIRPLHPGHTLVIPIEEVDEWTDLPAATATHAFTVARHVAVAQKAVVPCERIGVIVAGFEVPHAHIHVVPVDGMADLDFRNADENADPADLDTMAEHLRTALAAKGHSKATGSEASGAPPAQKG